MTFYTPLYKFRAINVKPRNLVRSEIKSSVIKWNVITRKASNGLVRYFWTFWVNNDLYDLSKFASSHPGGAFFITETRGMDITEMFESHHVDIDKARLLLKKYFVRKAEQPRNSDYSFSKSGFYYNLRQKVLPIWRKHKE